MKTPHLVLKLRRRPDPVLNNDELRYLGGLLHSARVDYKAQMDRGPVSESVIRNRYYAESIQKKLNQVIESRCLT